MLRIVLICCISLMLGACGDEPNNSHQGADSSQIGKSDVERTASSAESSGTRDPKWKFAVDGRPDISGRIITAVTVGGYGNYSMAGSNIIVSVSLRENASNPPVTIKYDDNVRCMNFGSATVTIEGNRGVVSGDVGCWNPDQKPDDHQNAGIEGWFELKK